MNVEPESDVTHVILPLLKSFLFTPGNSCINAKRDYQEMPALLVAFKLINFQTFR
jgi:hypothetical protein